jgi:hypothetical protein
MTSKESLAYQDVSGCPQCGGNVRFFVGDSYGKCLSCGENVPVIEEG